MTNHGVWEWLIAAALVTGCRAQPEPAPAKLAAKPPCLIDHAQPAAFDCPIHSCGNSATISGALVEALDTSGLEAQDLPMPFRLVRGSLIGAAGGCVGAAELSLEVRDGGLVAVDATGVERCAGDNLVGARFKLARAQPARSEVVAIRARGEVATASAKVLPTYDLVLEPAAGAPQPLCPRGTWTDDPVLGATEAAATTHALIVQGEVYAADATIARRGASWLNIGCAGSAIGKLRLHGLDPMQHTDVRDPAAPERSTTEERQAMLKMITGKYCGAESWTRTGERIRFRRAGSAKKPVESAGPIESEWTGDGARCVSHLRGWTLGGECAKADEATWVARLQRMCQLPACDDERPCGTAKPGAGTLWTSCTVDHVAH